jgi:hypothetical protein
MQLIFGWRIKVGPDLLAVFEACFVFSAGCYALVKILVVQVDPSHLQGIV